MLDTHFGISLNSKKAGIFQYHLEEDRMVWDVECFSIFGQQPETFSVTYKSWLSCIHSHDVQHVVDVYRRQIDARSSIQLHYRIQTPQGEFRNISTLANCLCNEQGKVEQVVGFHMDETGLNKTHRSLRDIQYAMDQVGIGIHFVKPSGHFFYVNQAACDMLGYTQDEMLSMAVWDIDPNFAVDSFDAVTKAMREAPGRIETTQKRQDGEKIPVEVTYRYIHDAAEQDGYFVAFMEDLTERREIEAESVRLQHQILQAQKMESIGHLAGGIAHDFNNMLGAILGYAELTRQLLNSENQEREKGVGFLDEILLAGNRAKELVSQMLLFSRKMPIDSGAEVPVVLIQPVVKEVVNLLRSSIPSSIDIQYRIKDADARCRVVPVQLHQVLLNLGINAADAIAGNGSVEISVDSGRFNSECTSCHQWIDDDYVVLGVSDNGSGISEELLPRICEPFFTTKEVGEGSGMGLSVVHGIVHSAGGHLSISNQDEGGTQVSVFLPVVEPIDKKDPVTPDSLSKPELKGLAGVSALIIDDEPSITSMLDVLLSSYGASANCFNQPEEALQVFKSHPNKFDVVISDVTMPSLSGLDIAQEVHAIRPEVPVILCSGYTNSFSANELREHNIADFFAKPMDFERLIRRIRELVD
jgi:two-component system cell cycle sensor histidine kinase/response regulator CckA